MKNLFKSIMMVAVAAISFTSCSNNFTEEIVTGEKIQFNVSAVNEEVTRSAFGEPSDKKYPTLWSGDEGFVLNINGADGETTSDVEATFSGDKRAVNLSANIEFETAPETYTLYAIAPATAYVSFQPSGWQVTIPTSQTTGTLSCDPKAQILVGASETKASASETFDMTFKHAVAYGKMSLKNLELDGAKISSVAITSTKNIAGRFYINQATREYSDNSGAKTITVNTTSTDNIWFALAPVDVSNTELIIVVNTDKGTFTKTVTMPANRKFELGKISTFNVSFDAKIEVPSELTATIDFSKAEQRTSYSTSEQVWSNAGITLTNTKGSSTSNIGNYTNPARFYKDSNIEITSSVGNMTKIAFVCNTAAYATSLNKSIAGSTVSGSTVTVTFAEPTNSFSCSMTDAQVRMNSLTVTYTPADANAPFIGLEKTSLDVDAAKTSEEVAVTLKNINESYVTVKSSATWVEADLAEGVLTLNIAENTDTATRTATVTISASEISETITINQEGVAKTTTIDMITAAGNYSIANAWVVATYAQGCLITDSSNKYILCYMGYNATNIPAVGTVVNVEGAVSEYGGLLQFGADSVITATGEKKTVDHGTVTEMSGADLDAYLTKPVVKYASFEGTLNISSNSKYYNVTVSGASTAIGSISYPTAEVATQLTALNGKGIKATGYLIGISSGKYTNMMVTSVEATGTTPDPEPGPGPEPGPEPEPEDPTPGTGGGTDDFATINANKSYGTYKTTAGWNCVNCCVLRGGNSDSNPNFKMFGEPTTRAICMNGKTTTVGKITSPTLTAGCGELEFNYGIPYSDSKIKFKVEIMQNGAVVKTFTVDKTSATKFAVYSREETVNVAGDFQIVFTNLCPSNNRSSNKDRTAIWNVKWTGYKN